MFDENETAADHPDELNRVDEIVLAAIFEATVPVGARATTRLVRDKGPDLSEATVSRSFARLDALGLTTSTGRKGRIPTSQGQAYVKDRLERDRRNADFDRALELKTVDEILDWLRARQLLEEQAAAMAARRADATQIGELTEALNDMEDNLAFDCDPTPVGLQFHRILARACGSPIFNALIGSLYSPSLVNVERALDVILRARGRMADSAGDHRNILNAIKKCDESAAAEAMASHLERLHSEARRFEDEASSGGLQETLRLIRAARLDPSNKPF